jgi:hypothetical protein
LTKDQAVTLLLKEMKRAETIHPIWPTDRIHQAANVAEEAGELTKAANEYVHEGGSKEAMKEEAIHTGAMALRFLINL